MTTGSNRKWVRYLQNVALLLASCVVGLVLLELVLRWKLPRSAFHEGLSLRPLQNHTFQADFDGVTRTVRYSTNKWGFRGDPIPEDWNERPTILTIGGSTTHCEEVSDDETWPAQLQSMLRVTEPLLMVQNAGIPGHSSRGHVLLMEQVVPDIKPDMVIALLGANDLVLSLIGNEEGRRYLDSKSWKYSLLAHSRVLQVAYLWKQLLVNKTPRVFDEHRFHRFVPVPLTDRAPLPDNLDDVLPTLPVFRENLARIIQLAKEQHLQILFLTQPTLYENNAYNDTISAGQYWIGPTKLRISGATWRKMLDRFNQTLIETCRERDVPCFDLASTIPPRTEYLYDDIHMTVEGDRLLAQDVSQYMQRNGLLDQLIQKAKLKAKPQASNP